MKYLIFSKDRPIQLELALNTCKHFSVDWDKDEKYVLYKPTSSRYKSAYNDLAGRFPEVNFVEQDVDSDFFSWVKWHLGNTEYVMFIVDDCIFTSEFSTIDIVKTIEIYNYNILGFSLRLGKNTKYCYPLNIKNEIPMFKEVGNSMIMYDYTRGIVGDFYYPLEVSSSIYKSEDILKVLTGYTFNNPNELEWYMHISRNLLRNKPLMLCYKTSVAFCNPINKVQNVNDNRAGTNTIYSPLSLLKKYEQGYRIKDSRFYYLVPDGCHQEVDFRFDRG